MPTADQDHTSYKNAVASIYPFSIPASSGQGREEAGAYLQRPMSGWQGTPWKVCQSIAGQHKDTQEKQPCTHPFIPKGNLERAVNLTVMFLDCVRKSEDPERTPTCTRRTCKFHAEGPPARGQNPGPSCCMATVLPTVPLCSPCLTS
ncbi:hypothetical protein XENORESO_001120 [Xenotaenia resolanae]|uniref:Uncharacterized protein n=1 Tax=Xenotaenia resolanae TaxID=208358 RepID=A0ABV0W604_9TELE